MKNGNTYPERVPNAFPGKSVKLSQCLVDDWAAYATRNFGICIKCLFALLIDTWENAEKRSSFHSPAYAKRNASRESGARKIRLKKKQER
jgi:hypothetical protein